MMLIALLRLLFTAIGGSRTDRVRSRLYPQPRSRDKFELATTLEPNDGILRDVVRESQKHLENWNSAWSKILDHVPPEHASSVRQCGRTLVRFHNPKTGMDMLVPRMCHDYYCPYCPRLMHYARTTYHARKLASLDPNDKEPLPRVLNLVFTLPPALHAWARTDPRVMPAWKKSVMRTIGQAYDYKGRDGCPVERAAFQEMGGIFNLHAIGDEATPWPKWAPHLDIIMPAWKRQDDAIVPLRATWPERFPATRKRYQVNLRDLLLPLAQRPSPRAELVEFLSSEFETVWHISRPPRTPSNPTGTSIVHVESAMHRIRYSCRPLFSMVNARLATNVDGEAALRYRIMHRGKGKRIQHIVPLGPALSQLESLREWMHGRRARSQVGILSKRSYDATARLAGHEPVRERVSRGLVLKAAYEMNEDRTFTKTRRVAPAPRNEEDSDDSG